ncbi:MAG TPA: polysaccharide deacetylase family protein [Opitutaceae bacterium]|nr:polysaccharide deacetylase family protein [Opitutaceae bacterium]
MADLAAKAFAVAAWPFSPWLAAAFFVGPDLYLLYHLLVPSAQGVVRVFTHFATAEKEVWLTIDDGPDETDTPKILELLDRHKARATFFVIGEQAARQPALVAEIVRRGHEVAHHTHTHPLYTFWCASPLRVRKELDDGMAALRTAGVQPRCFRPAVGIKNPFLHDALASRGLACIGWSVRSRDCLSREANRVVKRVLRQVRPGVIILMHEGPHAPRPIRVEAISRLLDALSDRGYACVVPETRQLRRQPPRQVVK